MNNSLSDYSYSSPYTTASPPSPFTPADSGIALLTLYNLSSGELSSDGMQSGRISRGSGSHSLPFPPSVPRSHRYNSIAAPTTRSKALKRKSSRNDDSDNEHEDGNFWPASRAAVSTHMRREIMRCQRPSVTPIFLTFTVVGAFRPLPGLYQAQWCRIFFSEDFTCAQECPSDQGPIQHRSQYVKILYLLSSSSKPNLHLAPRCNCRLIRQR